MKGSDGEDAILDALFEAGCDDAVVGFGASGLVGLGFTRIGKDAEVVMYDQLGQMIEMIRIGQTRNPLRASSSLLEIWPRASFNAAEDQVLDRIVVDHPQIESLAHGAMDMDHLEGLQQALNLWLLNGGDSAGPRHDPLDSFPLMTARPLFASDRRCKGMSSRDT